MMWCDLQVGIIEEFVEAASFLRRRRLRIPWAWMPDGKAAASARRAMNRRLNAEARAMRTPVPPVTAAFPIVMGPCPKCGEVVEIRPGCRWPSNHWCKLLEERDV